MASCHVALESSIAGSLAFTNTLCGAPDRRCPRSKYGRHRQRTPCPRRESAADARRDHRIRAAERVRIEAAAHADALKLTLVKPPRKLSHSSHETCESKCSKCSLAAERAQLAAWNSAEPARLVVIFIDGHAARRGRPSLRRRGARQPQFTPRHSDELGFRRATTDPRAHAGTRREGCVSEWGARH